MLKKYLPVSIVPLALVLWGLFGARELNSLSFRSFINYRSPYTEKSPPGRAGEALTSQVVVIVSDGLRHDSSLQMKNLNALRERGADRIVRVGQPSLSLPGWTVIGTGAWQEQHGQTTNFDARATPLDTIFQAARRRGLTTGLTGSPGWEILFKDQIDTLLIAPSPKDAHHDPEGVRRQDDAIEANALKILKENNPNFLLIHFTNPDNMSHGFGALSTESIQSVQDVDARLGRLLSAIDLSQTTLVVTSDHGHIDRGGHAGHEEVVLNVSLVAAGKGIRPGKYAPARQADIAPTVAVLLGTSIPADNQGDLMFDMLEAPAPFRAQRTVDWAQQIADRYTQIARVIGVGSVEHPKLAEAAAALAAGSLDTAVAAATADVQSTRDAVSAAREGRLQQERLARTPTFLLMLLPFAANVWLMSRMRWEFRRPAVGALAYFVIYYLIFFGRGNYFSLSMFNSEENIIPWFTARTIDAIISLVLTAVVVGLFSRGSTVFDTVLTTFNTAFFIAAVLWLQVSAFFWLFGFTWPWFIPDSVLGIKYYLDTLQTGAFMVSSPPIPTILVLPLIAVAVKWLFERIPGLGFGGAARQAQGGRV